MSKASKRKITVEINTKNKDQPKARPSVFERLGTKASNDYCRHWAQTGTCPYGKNCKYANTHTLISPSKQRAAKKDAGDPKNNKKVRSSSKEDPNKRLHSAIVKAGGPEPEWDNWDQTDLEYADADALEKRRQELQRELEIQMKMESKQSRKKEKKIKKRESSTSSSVSTSSSTDSSSSSDESSSASSSSSKESNRRKLKKTKPKGRDRDSSSSSEPEVRVQKKKAVQKAVRGKRSIPTHNKVNVHHEVNRAKKLSEVISPPRKPSAPKTPPSKISRSPTPHRGRRLSHTPPLKTKSSTPLKVSASSKNSKSIESIRKEKHGTPSPRPPPRERDDKDKHAREREKEREKEKEREREREREAEREKEREREREKERAREREREREKERERNHEKERESLKSKCRDRSVSPKRDNRSNKGDVKSKRGSPDSSASRDRNRGSQGRTHSLPNRRRDDKSPVRDDRRPDRSRDDERKRDDRDKRDIKDRSLERRKDDRRHDDRDRDRDRDRDNRDRDNRDQKRMTREEREAAREKEREEALARCQERQRERERLKKLAEKERERELHNMRGRDRDRERDRGLDKPVGDKVERLLPLPSERIPPAMRLKELSNDRQSERSNSKSGMDRLDRRDKSVDRGSDRSYNRLSDRNSDRDRNDRPSERSLERGPPLRDRRNDRNDPRGYDHSLDRSYNRNAERSYERERELERDNRSERDYPSAPRSHDSDRRQQLLSDEKAYDSPFDNRSLRDDRHYLDAPERDRYDEGVLMRDRLPPIDARDYPDDRRRRDTWDDMRDTREIRGERGYPRDNQKGRGDWDKPDYINNRHETWNDRGPQHEWTEGHREDWDQVEHPVVEDEWRGGYDRPPIDNWQGEDRRRNWQNDWPQERQVPPNRMPPRGMIPHREEPQFHGIKEEIHPDHRRNPKIPDQQPPPIHKPEPEPPVAHVEVPKETILGKRPADGPLPEVIEAKKPNLNDSIVLEDDLSEISDDADEILNREDENVEPPVETEVIAEVQPVAVAIEQVQPTDQDAPKDVAVVNHKPATPTSNTQNDLSSDHQSVDEEAIDQMDFEAISDEEFEEEAKVKGLGDALGVDWASLVAESRPRVKQNTGGSAKRHWDAHRVLARVGVSVKLVGVELAAQIFRELKEKELEDKNIEDNKIVENGNIKNEVKNEIKTEKNDQTVLNDVHPIGAMQVALKDWKAKRNALFAGAGPFKRALSARRDLAIRRHLCKLPAKDTIELGDTQPPPEPELFRLAAQLFERSL